MFAHADFDQLVETCSLLGQSVAESSGFVPMRALVERLKADIVVRPLLVEGMIAANGNRWMVLIDSERFGLTADQVDGETSARPLPTRVRNTIAHELAHTLIYRTTEFGMSLRPEFSPNKQDAEWVDLVERVTEKLSPLMLMPGKALATKMAQLTTPLDMSQLKCLQKDFAVSRDVFVNRFRMLRENDPDMLLEEPALRNLGIGIGEWVTTRRAALKSWPVFANFDRNITPTLFLKLFSEGTKNAGELLEDPDLAVNGGGASRGRWSARAGLVNIPDLETMQLSCELEIVRAAPKANFLYLIRRAAT